MQRYEDIPGINWSTLKLVETSPLYCDYRRSHPREDSPSMLVGRATHCAVLEPAEFAARYIVKPEGLSFATKDGKAWRAEQESSGLEVLNAEQGATVEACAASVRAHPEARALIEACDVEQAITWQLDGISCKGRLDLVARDGSFAGDLKTCRELRRFARDAAELCYHGQGGFYTDGGRAAGRLEPLSRYYLIAVESAEPYDVGVFELPPSVLEVGRVLYLQLLAEWASCRETGVWYGRHPTVARLELPRWAPGMSTEEV